MRIDAPSPRMVGWFAVTGVAMAAHKVECWLAREWLESPLFAWAIDVAARRGDTPEDALGAAIFLPFVLWLGVGLAMTWLVMRGGAGPLVVTGLWGLTFLLEWHHLGRALARGDYYPGLWTALVYVGIGPFYLREWLRHVHLRVHDPTPPVRPRTASGA